MPDSSPPSESPPSTGAERLTDKVPSTISVRNVLGPVLLSLLVLAAIGYFTFDASAFRLMREHLHPGFLGLAILTTFARVLLGGWRLSYIAQGRLNLMSGTRAQLAWEFFSNVTPSTIGGGPVATLYMARDQNLPVGETTAFFLFAMLMDQLWFVVSIPVIIVATFNMELIPAAVGDIGLWTFMAFFAGMLTWSCLFAYATLFRPDLLERLADRLFRFKYLERFHERVMAEMRTLTRRARTLRGQPARFYVKGFLITAGMWLMRYLLVLFVVWSVVANFDKLLLLFRTATMILCSLIMPTPGGSGGLEGLYAFFIGPLMPDALVAPTLLTWRTLGYYIFIALGAYLFIHQVQKALKDRSDEPDAPTNGQSDSVSTVPSPTTEPTE